MLRFRALARRSKLRLENTDNMMQMLQWKPCDLQPVTLGESSFDQDLSSPFSARTQLVRAKGERVEKNSSRRRSLVVKDKTLALRDVVMLRSGILCLTLQHFTCCVALIFPLIYFLTVGIKQTL